MRNSSEDHLNRFLAKEQNSLDHLTAKMYGPGIRFESLSAWGQYTIESLARERVLASDPDPELRTAKAQVVDLTIENERLTERLAKTLRDYEELWEENEQLKVENYERQEEDSRSRSRRRREARSSGIHVSGSYEGQAMRDQDLESESDLRTEQPGDWSTS